MDDSGQGRGPSSQHHAPEPTDGVVARDDGSDVRPDHSSGRGLSDHTQQRIGLHLRAMYDTIVQQPVPDRFRDLIAQLDASNEDEAGHSA